MNQFKPTIVYMDPEKLTPYGNNTKKHPVEQIDKIAAQINAVGFTQPIVVDIHNVIIAGHGRREAARRLGLTEVPVVVAKHLDENQIKAYRIADNKVAESEWEMDLLRFEMGSLDRIGFDLRLTGFDQDEIDRMLIRDENETTDGNSDPDDIPEAPLIVRSKVGDLYELGNHRLLCGDSTDHMLINTLMCGQVADLILTDPPYGIGNDRASGDTYSNHKPYDDTQTFDLRKINFPAEFVIFGGNYYEHLPIQRNKIGWVVWDKRPTRETWDQETRDAADRRFGQHFEIAITNVSGIRGKMIRKTWGGFYGTAGNPDDAIVHRTQKPIELITHFLADKHHIVLDYFGGSGSTLIACEKTKRKCFMMELDPHYIDVIVTRYVKFTGNNKIKLNGEPIEWSI